MEQKWAKVYENVIFMLVILAGTDAILAMKVCMMTGQMVYWWIGLVCIIVVLKCVCRKPTDV